ncbi:MAG: hypothetical protein A3J66_02515 [Candidatus Magasanikbacteria bacterium RIFCSPHIGHO2_02_FULL_47_14]|uniref:N-acetyltransferase domain-containing protein n=1 Tax=Candidatus Magasanikbacteria bacterium RIFCSPHIGHO2_02_FULL_47_14 TaxID=1798680 RepID=A0A1F6M8C9_9BACT|nr:MAG: hypothetical protein A3J66_02515 [Candidatus Magasanikbacteria bacterium RIFCSPHIGHO2_02_FULL_47_14]
MSRKEIEINQFEDPAGAVSDQVKTELPVFDNQEMSDKMEKRRAKEIVPFSEWQKQLESSQTLETYLTVLEQIPLLSAPQESITHLIAPGGLLDQIPTLSEESFPSEDWDRTLLEDSPARTVYKSFIYIVFGVEEVGEKDKEVFRQLVSRLLRDESAYVGSRFRRDEAPEGLPEEWKSNTHEATSQDSWEWEEIEASAWDDVDPLKGLIFLARKLELNGMERDVIDCFHHVPPAHITRDVAGALSKLDTHAAARELLGRIRSTETPEDEKDAYGRVLYLLELGQIGIRDNVVQYLDIQYSIQHPTEGKDRRQEVDFARRITGDGKIGLFDPKGGLIGFFELGDFVDPGQQRHVHVLEVSRELLFSDPNTPDNIRQEFLADYYDFYSKIFGEIGGFRMSDLTLREQVWMYQFWKTSDEQTWQRAVRLKEKFGIAGVKTFIALEQGEEIGGRLLNFAENSDIQERTKERVFYLYDALIDTLDQVKQGVIQKFVHGGNAVPREQVDSVTTQIAKRAYRLLHRFTSGELDESQIQEELSKVNKDVILFASVFRGVFHADEIKDFAEIQGIDFEMVSPNLLSGTDKQQMQDMLVKNNTGRDGTLGPFAETVVLPGLKKSFINEENRFFVLRQNGSVIAYYRMQDRIEEEDTYFGSFNVDTDATGAGLGTVLMQKQFHREAKNRKLVANVTVLNPAAGAYVNQHGFVITQFLSNVANTGTDGFEIVRDDRKGHTFFSKHEGAAPIRPDLVIKESFNLKTQRDTFVKAMEEKVNSGEYVVTNYSIDPRTGKCSCVFERVAQSAQTPDVATEELPSVAA